MEYFIAFLFIALIYGFFYVDRALFSVIISIQLHGDDMTYRKRGFQWGDQWFIMFAGKPMKLPKNGSTPIFKWRPLNKWLCQVPYDP